MGWGKRRERLRRNCNNGKIIKLHNIYPCIYVLQDLPTLCRDNNKTTLAKIADVLTQVIVSLSFSLSLIIYHINLFFFHLSLFLSLFNLHSLFFSLICSISLSFYPSINLQSLADCCTVLQVVFCLGLHRISDLFYIRYPAGYPVSFS